MINILEALARNTLISDGAMGTMLQGLGMPSGVSPEVWMLSNQDKILEVMSAYVRAGAEIIETNTFGASRLKLAEYGHENDVHLINTMAVSLAKRAAGADCYVAGVIGPSGRFPSPVGDTAMEDLIEVFAQQAQSISQGGADLILLQTFPDLGEARAAYLGARMATTLPVAVSLTYAANQRTLTGADPATAAVVFTALGADLLGVNCSTGPEEMLPIIEIYRNHSRLPLLAEPNAGVPYLEDGHTVFPMSPTDMAGYAHLFLAAGVRYLGGCCGTTPEHIRAIAGEAKSAPPPRPSIAASSAPSQTKFSHTAPSQTEPSHTAPSRSALASLSKTIYLGAGFPPRLIGERLNPTGRKVIANAITERDFGAYASEGRAQQQSGADLLDVNVGFAGSAGGNEAESMVMAICNIQQSVDCPLIIDSVDPYVIRQALIHYQGKALINSVNGKETSLQAILPLAKQYGAAVLGLTLDEAGVPADADTRFAIAERILSRALALGVPREDVYIDCLVMASAADPWQAAETLKAVSMIKEKLGLITVLGVSNISHGMPRRPWLNQVFLAQCIAAGVDAVMVNPLDPATRPTIAAAAFLAGRDPQGVNYIRLARNDPANSGEDPASTNDPTATIPAPLSSPTPDASQIHQAIIHNDKQQISQLLQPLLAEMDLIQLANLCIVPALHIAGDSYASGETFLPQLLLSAEGAAFALEYMKAAMPEAVTHTMETVVLGTVDGDIHDIGKNIVKALLSSYGYQVVDLGRSVPASAFVEAVKEHNAQILGLSALMTTTMTEMDTVIKALRSEGLHTKILVGGAVLTQEYAASIGADAYVKDAVDAHSAIRNLLDV